MHIDRFYMICQASFFPVLQNVLDNDPTHTPIVQIGPFTITNNSIHCLNSTISDEVYDISRLVLGLRLIADHEDINIHFVYIYV